MTKATKKVNYGKRVRNVFSKDYPFGRILTEDVKPGNGPKAKRYGFLCCGAANWDCIRCRLARPI